MEVNKILKILYFCCLIAFLLDCGTTVYGFEYMGSANINSDSDAIYREINSFIYNSIDAVVYFMILIGIVTLLYYFSIIFSNDYLRYFVITILGGYSFLFISSAVTNILIFL